MPSTSRTTTAHAARSLTLFSLFTAAIMGHARAAINQPARRADLTTYKGCYSDATPLTGGDTWTYQSSGYCSGQCTGDGNQAVMGLSNGDECWCGSQLPSDDNKVDDSKCNSPCTGYGTEDCGGNGFWSVYLTGTETDVPVYGGGSSSSSSSSSSNGGGGGGSNTAGIAAGAVVGVVAFLAIIGGLFFWIRHKKKKEAEEAYKQRTQVADFMRGSNERKPPTSSGYSHMSDQRLDPEAGRRNSVGSLADANDYSRRILRVANPDSS